MSKNCIHVIVRKETRDMIDLCRKEFLAHHPEFKHTFLSQDKIIYEAFKYYLEN
jgi:hypothetical protein